MASVATVRTVAIPQLVADLDTLGSGYRGVQPCIAALLTRVALIDSSVVAIPESAAVRARSNRERMPRTSHERVVAEDQSSSHALSTSCETTVSRILRPSHARAACTREYSVCTHRGLSPAWEVLTCES